MEINHQAQLIPKPTSNILFDMIESPSDGQRHKIPLANTQRIGTVFPVR
jgi:hypothetical protein